MEANVLMPKFVPAAMPAVGSILKTIGNLTTPITNPTYPRQIQSVNQISHLQKDKIVH